MHRSSHTRIAAIGILALAGISTQVAMTTPVQAVESEPNLQRQALLALSRPITLAVEDQPLSDLINYIAEVTGAELEPMYEDDFNAIGLDPEMEISIDVKGQSALAFLERVLSRAQSAAGLGAADGYTWQLTEDGVVQIGPKERLNSFRRVEIYDILDLIIEIRDFPDAPAFDLQSVLSNSSGGGGGQSPFSSSNSNDDDRISQNDRANSIQDIITAIVEPEQWQIAGGDAATLTFFQGSLIVNAPDYIHRQLNGYPFWPSKLTRTTSVNGRRTVTLRPEPAIARPRSTRP